MRTTTQIALSEQVRHRVLPLVAQVIDEATEPAPPRRTTRARADAANGLGRPSGRGRRVAGHGALDSNAVPLSPAPPLRQLWEHADRHRPKVVLATIFSVLNKICDIAPELLIGAAVDVVVGDGQSFIGTVFGVEDPFDQLYVLAIITVVVWVLESLTDYIAEVLWRNLAQDIEHDDAHGRLPARPGARARLLRGPHRPAG